MSRGVLWYAQDETVYVIPNIKTITLEYDKHLGEYEVRIDDRLAYSSSAQYKAEQYCSDVFTAIQNFYDEE